MDIATLLTKQKEYFASGATLPVKYRISALKRLYDAVSKNEGRIAEALHSDLGKSDFEGYMCEIGMTLSEIRYLIKHTPHLMRRRYVRTPMAQFCSKSYTLASPYGSVLIMSPWNYPLLLTLEPLAAAIAAGNTAIVKPSAYSPATSAVVSEIISECFAPEQVSVVLGGRRENSELLLQKFDMIFFTGSQTVGKEVLRHAAEGLIPVVLELGGKSPCIVDKTAKLPLAARRIVFGKFLNCGQTCVAPDFIICHASVKDALIAELSRETVRQFSTHPLENADYGHIVNEKHFDRLLALIDREKLVLGGGYDREALKLEPTLMDRVTFSDPVMQEEIFGPILPVLTYESEEELVSLLRDRQKPLAMYIFSEDRPFIDRMQRHLPFGGGCVNDTVIHLATSELPFGGVGESGMGSYHGKYGFETFSHRKGILDKKTFMDLSMRYQPYDRQKSFKTIRSFLK